MKLYRVTNQAYANQLSGKGASYTDGARWNSPGVPVIYFALDMATALLEAANYHPSPKLVPPSHCKAIYQAPEDVKVQRLDPKALPADWQTMPYPTSTQQIGDTFLRTNKSLLLLVPSVAVGVNDYAIAICNPAHVQAQRIQLLDTITPVYSARMFSGL